LLIYFRISLVFSFQQVLYYYLPLVDFAIGSVVNTLLFGIYELKDISSSIALFALFLFDFNSPYCCFATTFFNV